MSEYIFQDNGFQFRTGWDDPCRFLFLAVEDLKNGELVWSNVNDKQTGPDINVDQLRSLCAGFGATIPEMVSNRLELEWRRGLESSIHFPSVEFFSLSRSLLSK